MERILEQMTSWIKDWLVDIVEDMITADVLGLLYPGNATAEAIGHFERESCLI